MNGQVVFLGESNRPSNGRLGGRPSSNGTHDTGHDNLTGYTPLESNDIWSGAFNRFLDLDDTEKEGERSMELDLLDA